MTWPKLVPPAVCHTRIVITLTSGVNIDGSDKTVILYDGMCNYSEKSRQILNAERQMVQLQAQALIDGDICPGQDITGDVVVYNAGSEIKRRIYTASRGRNPDGTVNFTQLDLM